MNKNSLKKLIPLLFGLFLVYYSYNNTSIENRADILNYISKADYKFVLLSIFFGILSHLSRAFRWKYLKQFTAFNETRLELLEACDSNRILDMNFSQYIAPYPSIQSFSVDSLSDLDLVKTHILNDGISDLYL